MAQTSTYDNVPVYTGQHLPQESAGFFQPPAPTADGILASDQARAVCCQSYTRSSTGARPAEGMA